MSRYLNQLVQHDLNYGNSAPNHVYLDVACVNNDNGVSAPIPISFNESRTTAILEDASMYYLTIIRFHIDTFGSIPCIIPQIQVGPTQTDVNLTIYSVTFKFGDVVKQYYLEFSPQDLSAPTPAQPLVQQDTSTSYYYVNSYSYFVNMLNGLLSSAFEDFAGLASLPTTHAPFFQYDTSSGEIIANADVQGYDTNSSSDFIEIYFNTALYNLLSSFEYKFYGYSAPDGKNYRLNVRNDNNSNILEISDTYSVYQCYQEYPSIATWSPVSRIIFTSPNLPMNPSIVSPPKIFNSIQGMNNVTTQTTTMNVITDMEVNVSNGKEIYPSVLYLPYHYRLIDLTTRAQLNEFTIQVYWSDIYGTLRPFLLPSGCSCDMKLLFIRKSFYN